MWGVRKGEFRMQWLWDQSRLANGKAGSACQKHGGKMSVMSCSPLRVLENIVVSDAMDKDIIFPIGINILRLE